VTAPEPPEAVLIARARAGDREAFGVLVTRHERLAFRTAYVLCGDSAEAQDATQEGFLKAYVALPRFRPGAPFRPWLLRIVGNEARNRARSAGRRAQLVTRIAGQDGAARSAAGADVAVLAGVRRAALATALSRLAPDHREILVLRYLLDLSEQDCAAVLDCRPGTVKSRHARALARLRAELAEEETADA
jgi:RNA polymerase sigma-70 factor (ECF subfamily)